MITLLTIWHSKEKIKHIKEISQTILIALVIDCFIILPIFL